ncbi:MAG: hypothetical protein HQ488_02315 [Parcubacteria group bacterium]|nr:hypothetical protein [Parcubacteria group bacterium]
MLVFINVTVERQNGVVHMHCNPEMQEGGLITNEIVATLLTNLDHTRIEGQISNLNELVTTV